jgi:hypothetical protein
VSATSAAVGLPGGWWLAGTLPTDLTQYFWHVIGLAQKLAYLHGWPELLEEGQEIEDETRLVLTMFIAVSLGIEGATGALNRLATAVGAETARRLRCAPLTKYALYTWQSR